ncbi:hypothetical protein SPHINGO391_510022 [Sphingomonas aurantiaca]|uniref:Uncharacterized protein n=1 Tax=Sphingomonas aurantiaca TaxID=185949 RepID=A0A5E8AC20_9SPHN|nr:hypothetical protein SPHINGO391_510022 [Sphingomonas aurantiaca]
MPLIQGVLSKGRASFSAQSVILTKVRIQSHEGHPRLLWILTFVRMTEAQGCTHVPQA